MVYKYKNQFSMQIFIFYCIKNHFINKKQTLSFDSFIAQDKHVKHQDYKEPLLSFFFFLKGAILFCMFIYLLYQCRHYTTYKIRCIITNVYLNINQLDALNFIMSLFHASTCFEHMCSSSGGQNYIIQHLVSSHLQVAIRCAG